jgi:hypothetical protein
VAILLNVRRFLNLGAVDSRSMRSEMHACMKTLVGGPHTCLPFHRILRDLRCDLIQRPSMVLYYGTLSSYLRYGLHGGGACCVASLHAPTA